MARRSGNRSAYGNGNGNGNEVDVEVEIMGHDDGYLADITDEEGEVELEEEEAIIKAQLEGELHAASARALRSRRPILTHLNADTSWLVSVPVPRGEYLGDGEEIADSDDGKREEEEDTEMNGQGDGEDGGNGAGGTGEKRWRSGGRRYFHIVLDPWLKGSQSDVAAFFSRQWHMQESACQTIEDIEAVIQRIEHLAASSSSPSSHLIYTPSPPSSSKSAIDLILISHEFTDHMHEATLRTFPRTTPLLAPSKALGLVASWKHFTTLLPLPAFTTNKNDWRETAIPPLPRWLGVSRVAKEGVDLLYYHSAVLIAFRSGAEKRMPKSIVDDTSSGMSTDAEAEAEAIIYTPHGLPMNFLPPLLTASPPLRTLLLLHGLHDVKVSAGQLNLGAHAGLKVQRATGAKYWVPTHDEVKRGGGLVSYFLKRVVVGVEEAVEAERREREALAVEVGKGMADWEDGKEKETGFVEVGNGESLVLV